MSPTGPAYRGRRLDGTLREFHQAVDLLDADTVPESYYLQVIGGRQESAEPAVPKRRGSGGGGEPPPPVWPAEQLDLTIGASPAHADPRAGSAAAGEGWHGHYGPDSGGGNGEPGGSLTNRFPPKKSKL